jgi:hypothetical protein
MTDRFWLDRLPSTDPAFAPLQRVAAMDPEEFGTLAQAHRQAMSEAAWGRPLEALDAKAEELRLATVHDREPWDDQQAEVWRRDELEALGYALGVTAVRVAIREHTEEQVAA